MRVVIDANIFVSGFIWGGLPRAAVERVADKSDKLLLTDEIIDEIERVFRRPKFKKDNNFIDSIIDDLKKHGERVAVCSEHKLSKDDCRDPKDIKYLECAIAGNADCVISGDKDLRVLTPFRGIKIITVREYLDIVL